MEDVRENHSSEWKIDRVPPPGGRTRPGGADTFPGGRPLRVPPEVRAPGKDRRRSLAKFGGTASGGHQGRRHPANS
eukprot:scaffold75560_cov45-Phaeocystis_antarctica.AAC.1